MKKIITGVAAGLGIFLVTRTLAYLLGLDALAARLATEILRVPPPQLYLVGWLLSALVGLIALVAWLVFNVDTRLSSLLFPRPPVGSLPHEGDPTLKIEVNRKTNKNTAELFVDLINKNDRLIVADYVLKATVNGVDLVEPVYGQALAAPSQKIRLFVRVGEVPLNEDLLAYLAYDVSYHFKGARGKSRKTAKGIEWKSQVPEGQPGPSGGKVVKVMTVRFYNHIEE